MATTDIGRAVPLMRGEYSPSATYELNDIVTLNGSMYWHYSHAVTTNVAPQATDTWMLVLDLTAAEEYISRAESAAETAEEAKDDAVTAKTAAETASASASGSSTAASAAETAAETAKDAAIAAKDAAVSAKTDAESAKTAAQTAATAASGSATAANSSAGNAEYYAGEASTAATTATEKADEASASAATASSAATTATGAKDTAVSSAATATTKAGEASTSATSAASSAAAAQAVKDSIPQDYTSLSNDVADVKTQLKDVDEIIGGKYVRETLLDGSVGNAGNANAVCTGRKGESTKNTITTNIADAKTVKFITSRPLAEGHKYGIGYTTFDANKEQITEVPVSYAIYGVDIPVISGWVYIAWSLLEQDENGTQVALRTTDFETYKCYTSIMLNDGILQTKADKSEVIAVEGEVSAINNMLESKTDIPLTYDANTVWDANSSTAVGATIATKSASGYRACRAIPVKEGEKYIVSVRRRSGYYFAIFVDVSNKFISGDILGTSLDSELVDFTVIVPSGAKYMLINTYFAEPKAVKVDFSEITSIIHPNIIQLNKDVEVAVNAASNYMYRTGNAQKWLSFLVTTDVHSDATRFSRAIEYLNAMNSIDFGVCLGDMQAAYYSGDITWYIQNVMKSNKRFLTVIGNHDMGNNKSTTQSGTVSQAYSKYIQPLLSKIGDDTISKTYYAVNFDSYKVTAIVLNVYDLPDTVVNGEFAVSRTKIAYSQAQIDWLIETLDNVPSDYHVCLLYHQLNDANTKDAENPFNETNFNYATTQGDYVNVLSKIIDAWINGTSITESFAPTADNEYLPTITVNHDFSTRGHGIFIGHIVGHMHRDYTGHITAYPDQNINIFVQTANDNNQNSSQLPRAIGTKAEDAITVGGINTTNKLICIVRVGANVSNVMLDRTFTAIPYDT